MLAAGSKRALGLSALLFWGLLTAAIAEETVAVRAVFDGDSFVLADGREARLIGINAPEFGKDGAPDQPLAAAARDRLAGLTRGRPLTLRSGHEPRDRYGRWLVQATLPDGSSVEEILLREGLAWAIAIPPNLERLERLLAAENEARAAGRGVWREAAYAPRPAAALTAGDSGFRFIEGTIQRHSRGRHAHYFDLASHVALVVPREDWEKYFDVHGGAAVAGDGTSRTTGGKPADLVGRRVVARGWLTVSGGRLRLRVPHPSMLTFVK